MTVTDAHAFVERFQQVWQEPDPDGYADLWHEDGILRHPTMRQALPQDQIPDYIRRLKTVAPDISLVVERWADRGDTVLIEWTLTATVGEDDVEIEGVDRFTLRGDRASEGVAYFDTMPLWARIDPSVAQDEALEDRLHAMVVEES